MYELTTHENPGGWDDLIARLPGAHLLQSWEWGQAKTRLGWRPLLQVWMDRKGKPVAAALVLLRALSFARFSSPLRMIYSPKGPLLDWRDPVLRQQVLADLQRIGRQHGAFTLKIDPEVRLGTGVPGSGDAVEDPLGAAVLDDLRQEGWLLSNEQVQYRNTVLIDLRHGEDELLAGMKQKTRYNIRLAQRRGVSIRPGTSADLAMLYQMYAETAQRDGFVIRDESYYLSVWETFMRKHMAEPLLAEVEGDPVAALVWFHFAGRAWYLHGMSRDRHREKMPNHLLQWEAMQRARARGCREYDMWGAPDIFQDDDPMWGVYRFKRGFNGTLVRHIGAWDFPLRPLIYRLFTRSLPAILAFMRRRGRARTRRHVTPE